jgi:plastocyanin
MRKLRRRRALVLLGLAAMLALPAVVAALPDSSATVRFGNDSVGSPFPPPDGHDASFNGKDNVIPRTAVISAPGTVTWNVLGVHQVAVYRPGIAPEDIVPTGDLETNPFVDDPNGRLALQANPFGPPRPPTYEHAFSTPGKYLIICNFLPHFIFAKMYGWVDVK